MGRTAAAGASPLLLIRDVPVVVIDARLVAAGSGRLAFIRQGHLS